MTAGHLSYLLFDLAIGAPTLSLGLASPGFRARVWPLFVACAWISVPFVVWDACVVGRDWWFEPGRTLGLSLLGLPLEEVLFFFVVPFSSVFLWDTAFRGSTSQPIGPRWPAGLAVLGLLAGAVAFHGRSYTALALCALAAAIALDDAFGTRLFARPRFFAFLAAVLGLELIFNGILTRLPIVRYGPTHMLGVRVGTIPLEDFAYGLSLVSSVAAVFSWKLRRTPSPSWLGRLIARRLGGYRQEINAPDPRAPERLQVPRSVAVIGGGLAGLSAAALLAERGFRVRVYEKNPYLGGKLGAWRETLEDGFQAPIEHGFHAFFRHYYNLNALLGRLKLQGAFTSIGRYVILTRGGERLTFGEDRAAPGLNLLGLAQRGLFRLREVAKKPVRTEMEQFLRYDPVQTFAALDAVPFSELARRAQLPPRLQAVFTAFGRAFFAAPEELSAAELIKSFHFYYLSHDLGLVYDHVSGGTMSRLLDGLRAHLQAHGAEVLLGAAVERIDRADGHLSVAGQAFDHVVLAADVSAARGVVDRSPWIGQADPALAERLQALHAGRRYAVWRIWIDARAGDDLPAFVSTERLGELDAIAFVDRLDPECGQWASAHGGAVLELHAYALTDQAKTPDDVRCALLAELFHHLPALRQATVVHQHLQLRDDFTAFHLGQHGHRPPVATAVGGLVLAGDWVALPMPAMLMEAAHTAGRLAANVILSAEGLRETPVASVPLRGVLLGPQR